MTDYRFLAWVRAGAAASLAHGGGSVPTRGRLDASVTVRGGGAAGPITTRVLPIELYGPGDVGAFDVRQIVRVYPLPGTHDAETTKFPLVEFDRPDFPWLFTPFAAPAWSGDPDRRRLRPWVALVCVPVAAAAGPRGEPGRPLPVLRVDNPRELPDPATLDLWAHAQVLAANNAEAAALLAPGGDPLRSVSRLLAPRRLLPFTEYVACVVPAFEAGRLAALGETGGDLTPAWRADQAAVLPVFFSWRFATSEAGDFETLAARLRARPLPASVGRRPLDVRRPGLIAGLPVTAAHPTVELESALRAPDADASPPWPVDDDTRALRRALALALNADDDHDDDGDDPVVLPPRYGGFHALRGSVDLAAAGWFDTLNLDPRWRVAAGLGTRAVRREQEELMASAWKQLADVRAANRFLDLARLARLVGASLHDRHVAPLPADQVLHLGAPLQPRAPRGAVTLRAEIADSALPDGAATLAFRRATRPRGTLARRVARAAGPGLAGPPFTATVAGVAVSPSGLATRYREPDGTIVSAIPPERVVPADKLPGVQTALTPPSGATPPWPALVQEALDRARHRDRATVAELAASPPPPPAVIDASFRVDAVPEVSLPPSFFAATTLRPDGSLRFPSGASTPAGLAPLVTEPPADRVFKGRMFGPWAEPPWTGPRPPTTWYEFTWRGDCSGTWAAGPARRGTWRGVFSGYWTYLITPAGDVPGGDWRVVYSGTWASGDAEERGSWQGICTGTWANETVSSDGVMTGTWRSEVSGVRGSWHGTCPGTWDIHNWWADCTGAWHPAPTAGDVHRAGHARQPGAEGRADAPRRAGRALGGAQRVGPIPAAWHPDQGIPLANLLGIEYLRERAGRLAAAPILGAGPADMRGMLVDSAKRVVRLGDLPAVEPRPRLALAAVRRALVELTDPRRAVATVVDARIQRPGGGAADPADPVQWAPSFPAAMWPALAALSEQWMLAGLEHVPPDTATVVVTNQRFVEAYLVGLNHEFARELRWREYPTDQRGTSFTNFWAPQGGGPGPVERDIQALHRWAPTPLGTHRDQPAGGRPDAERIVLLVRSALLRRYPGATVYAAPVIVGPHGREEPDDARARPPRFRGTLDAETTFLGFDLTEAELRAAPWCFVIAEQPSEPRFGIDDIPGPGRTGSPPAFGRPYQTAPDPVGGEPPDDWNALDWSHLFDNQAAFEAATHAPGGARFNVSLGAVTWGDNAAVMARQCFQQPVRVVLPAARLLDPPEDQDD